MAIATVPAQQKTNPLSPFFDQAETMTEWNTAESYRSMLRAFEDLLLCRIRVESFCESDLEVINMNVHVPWRPMTLIVARLMSKLGRLRAGPLFKQAKLCVACSEYGDSGDRFGVLRKSKSVYVETNSVCKVGYINAE